MIILELAYLCCTVYLTRYLSEKENIGIVLGPCISTLILIAINTIQNSIFPEYLSSTSQLIYAASFIGMTSKSRLSNKEIFICPIIMIYILKFLPSSISVGVGGTLGFSAFLSVCCIYLLKRLTNSKFFNRGLN